MLSMIEYTMLSIVIGLILSPLWIATLSLTRHVIGKYKFNIISILGCSIILTVITVLTGYIYIILYLLMHLIQLNRANEYSTFFMKG
jgi:hypothetical protein